MKRISLSKQKGMVSSLMAVAILLLAISLPVTVMLVQKSQENRSKAAEEIVEFEDDLTESVIAAKCGGADGKSYAVRPTADLCEDGDVVWKDSSGSGGSYLWSCLGDDENNSVDCSAEKLLKEEGGSLDGRCGDANGMDQNSKPISDYVLCKAGELNWTDDLANDGDFNWSCGGLNGGSSVDCLAFKSEE